MKISVSALSYKRLHIKTILKHLFVHSLCLNMFVVFYVLEPKTSIKIEYLISNMNTLTFMCPWQVCHMAHEFKSRKILNAANREKRGKTQI